MTISGIDVSSIQGKIDWVAVARSGVRFAFLKCAQGNESGIDPFFRLNVQNAKAAGVVVGPYNFGYPLPISAEHPGRGACEQAESHFKKAGGLGNNSGELPAALDLEWPAPDQWNHWGTSSQLIRDWGLEYLARYAELSGRKPLVYTYPYFWAHVTGEISGYSEYPLWGAQYGGEDKVPAPWTSYTFRQTTGGKSGMTLPGGVPVDNDEFRGTEEDFTRLLTLG